jgi:invasion protein IalB
MVALGTAGALAQAPVNPAAITPPILQQQPASGAGAAPQVSAPAPTAQPRQAPAAQPAAAAAGAAPAATPNAASVKAFGDWSLECFDPALEGVKCQIVNRLVSSGKQVVLVFSLALDAKASQTRVQIALPLGIAVPPGVGIAIGNEVQRKAAVSRCTPKGCIVEGVATKDLLDTMRAGAQGAVIVTTEEGKPVQLPFSLNGFTAAYDAMSEANAG